MSSVLMWVSKLGQQQQQQQKNECLFVANQPDPKNTIDLWIFIKFSVSITVNMIPGFINWAEKTNEHHMQFLGF